MPTRTTASPSTARFSLRSVEATRDPGDGPGRITVRGDVTRTPGGGASPISVRSTVRFPDGTDVEQITTGVGDQAASVLEWTVDVGDPEGWSPHPRGAQPLYEVTVDELGDDGTTRANWVRRVGFRTVSVDHAGGLLVDGARMFLKGSAWGPGGPTDRESLAPLVELARDAGLDLLRVGADAPAALFDLADELGLLIVCEVDTIDVVRRLAAHPSIVAWSPIGPWFRRRALTATVPELDPARPVVDWAARRPTRLGWTDGDERDLPDLLRRRPRRARLLTGFGAPSSGADPDALGESEVHARHHQAMVVRFHVESARRLKYSPAIGFVHDRFATSGADENTSVLDASGRPKEAYVALQRACRPVLAIAERLPPHLHGNEALAIDVHLVNDRITAVEGARLDTTLRWADGSQHATFTVDAAPDSVRRVTTLQLVVPEVSGPLELDLELRLTDGTGATADPVTSSYRSEIFADPHDH